MFIESLLTTTYNSDMQQISFLLVFEYRRLDKVYLMEVIESPSIIIFILLKFCITSYANIIPADVTIPALRTLSDLLRKEQARQ